MGREEKGRPGIAPTGRPFVPTVTPGYRANLFRCSIESRNALNISAADVDAFKLVRLPGQEVMVMLRDDRGHPDCRTARC